MDYWASKFRKVKEAWRYLFLLLRPSRTWCRRLTMSKDLWIGFRKVQRSRFPHWVTWMEDSRPGRITVGVKLCIEPDVQTENIKILQHPGKTNQWNSYANVSYFFYCFCQPFIGLSSASFARAKMRMHDMSMSITILGPPILHVVCVCVSKVRQVADPQRTVWQHSLHKRAVWGQSRKHWTYATSIKTCNIYEYLC